MILGYLGIDQNGAPYRLKKHPRKELIKQTGYKHASKMYLDLPNGKIVHIGYRLGPLMIHIYEIRKWNKER